MFISPNHIEFLTKEFEKLQNLNGIDKQQRGKIFEDFMTQIFKFSGYEAINSQKQTLYDEQIDIHAFGSKNILLECKWLEKRVGIRDVESFAYRLLKRDPTTIGLFIAVNGISKAALNFSLYRTDRALVFLKLEEIKEIISGSLDLAALIDTKIIYLQRGIAYFHGETDPFEYITFPPIYPASMYEESFNDSTWILNEDNRLDINSPPQFIYFSNTIPAGQQKYSHLTFYPKNKSLIQNLGSFIEILNSFYDTFGFTRNLSYAFGQTSASWSGFGINNFFKAYTEQDKRYNQLKNKENLHHSEIANILDFWEDQYYITFGLKIFNLNHYKKSNERLQGHTGLSDFDINLIMLNDETNDEKIEIFAKKARLFYEKTSCEIRYKRLNVTKEKIKLLIPVYYIFTKPINTRLLMGGIAKNPFFDNHSDNTREVDPSTDPLEYIKSLENVYVYSTSHFTEDKIDKLYVSSINVLTFEINSINRPVIVDYRINWED